MSYLSSIVRIGSSRLYCIRLGRNAIALLALVAVLASTCVAQPANADPLVIQKTGVTAKQVGNFDRAGAELVKQTENADIYKNADGTSTALIGAGQINFQDAGGAWKKVDNNLRVEGDRIVNAAGPVAASFSKRGTTQGLVKLQKDRESLSFAPQLMSAVEPVIEANTVTYPDAFEGADLRYTVTAEGVREHIIVKEKSAAKADFRFFVETNGVKATQGKDGAVSFAKADGSAAFHMPKGLAWDSSNKKHTGAGVRTRLEGPGSVLVSVDNAWLNSNDRQFPITIDPDVILGSGTGSGPVMVGDTHTSSANPNTNYNGSVVSKIGRCASGDENYTYIDWDMSLIQGQHISSASMTLHPTYVPPSSVTAVQPVRMWHVNEPWDPSTFTLSAATGTPPQGNHDLTGKDLFGMVASGTQYSYDITDWARNWSGGAWPNFGVSMDAGGHPSACWNIFAQEASNGTPSLAVTFGDPDTGRRDFMSYFDQKVDSTTNLSVNLSNGNLNLSSTDLEAPGLGKDLAIERNWSSLRASGSKEFGNGWSLGSNQARVVPNAVGATVYLPGNSPVVFAKTNVGYSAPAGINATLVKTATGWTLSFLRTDDVWTFKDITGGRAYLHKQADRNNNTITYNYSTTAVTGDDNWPQLTSITDTFGQTATVTYTGNVITKIADWTGRDVEYVTTSGKLIRSVDLKNNWHTYGYNSAGMINYLQTPEHRELALSYDSKGRANTVEWYSADYPTRPTWSFSYTNLTNGEGTTTVTDPNGKATVYTWDSSGRVIKTVDPVGNVFDKAWTPNSDAESATSGTGDTTTASHDGANNITGVQAPDVDPSTGGRSVGFAYTNIAEPHQPSSATDTQGNQTSFLYNGAGNRTTSTNSQPSSNQAKLDYDNVNNNGNIVKATDGKGNFTTYAYTGGRLTSIDHPGTLGTEYFTYDALGRVQTHTNGSGNVATYNYDAMSQVTSVSVPGATTISYTYDRDGLLTARTDSAGTWGYTYDEMRRITNKAIPSGSSNSATYDRANNVLTYADSNGTINYRYDDANNLIGLAEPGGSCTGTVTLCTTFTYDGDNRREDTTYPSGVKQEVRYDTSGRVRSIKAFKGSTVITDYVYSYKNGTDDSGLTQDVTDNVASKKTAFYYDSMNRLTNAITHSLAGAYLDEFYYDWDPNSNRTAVWRLGGSTQYSNYNAADQLTSNPSGTFSYDGNGNTLTGPGGFASSYNQRGQATSITGVGGTAQSMTYADSGQAERTQRGATTFRTRLIGGLADETTGGVVTSYVMDSDGNLISQNKGGTKSYYLMDKLGSVVALTSNTGALQQRFDYDPFGTLLTTSITTDSAFKFAGGYYDTATKLYKFGERYYNPVLGIWTQRDTLAGNIVDPKTMNRYVYVGGSPLDYVDPSGRSILSDTWNGAQKLGGQLGTAGALGGCAVGSNIPAGGEHSDGSSMGCVAGAGVGGAAGAVAGGVAGGIAGFAGFYSPAY